MLELDRPLFLIQVYGPNTSVQYAEFVEEANDALRKIKLKESIILLGDLNAHVWEWCRDMEACDWQTWWCWREWERKAPVTTLL